MEVVLLNIRFRMLFKGKLRTSIMYVLVNKGLTCQL